jgi:uncharacterized protein YcfL
MKKEKLLLVVVGISLLLGGCALSKEVDTTTLIVDKKGAVVENIVEDFDKDYYDADALEQMISEEISNYNSTAGSEKVKLDSFELAEEAQQVKVKIQYETGDDYGQMNDRELFCGTVSEAYQAGYEFTNMINQDNSEAVSGTDVLELGDKKVIISEEALDIQVPGKIIYASEGVVLTDNKTATLPDDGEALSYIIYE